VVKSFEAMVDPATITLWAVALLGAGAVIARTAKFCFWLYDGIKERISSAGHSSRIPRETLRIALKNENDYWWHMGSWGDNPIMQVVGDFFITNICDRPVRLPQMELRYGFWGRKRVRGAIMVEGPNQYYGMYDIAPNSTRDSRADFWIFPPVRKSKEPFLAHSVVFYDQFGNPHVVKKLRFGYT